MIVCQLNKENTLRSVKGSKFESCSSEGKAGNQVFLALASTGCAIKIYTKGYLTITIKMILQMGEKEVEGEIYERTEDGVQKCTLQTSKSVHCTCDLTMYNVECMFHFLYQENTIFEQVTSYGQPL